ncbi:MAG: phosphatidate cytidylyltransferase [Alkalibacterium sp.]|nr:phosphatidate cytidylyltransferase [Alkalibacterium sp.]
MLKRVATAVIALILFIPILFIGGWPLLILMGVLALLGQIEFIQMNKLGLYSFPALLSGLAVFSMVLSPILAPLIESNIMLKIVSLLAVSLLIYSVKYPDFKVTQLSSIVLMTVYIGVAFYSFAALRVYSLTFLMLVLLVIWSTDSGAYLIGRKIGKTKLAPKISPNKTIEGSIGGTVVSTVISAVYLIYFPLFESYLLSLLFMVVISIAGQIGDLVESKIKREYNVKDSGNLLPGHGGILDRFDSLLLVLNLLFIIGLL